MKRIGEVSPPVEWRAWTALIDEDSGYCNAHRRLLTTRCHGHIIINISDKVQAASLRVEIGNPGLVAGDVPPLYLPIAS